VPFDDGAAEVVAELVVLGGDVLVIDVVAAEDAGVVAASSPDPPLQPAAASTPAIATATPIPRVTRMDVPLPVQNLSAS